MLAPPATGIYRILTRLVSLIYCTRLFTQYKASYLSEASCLTGTNELDTAKMTVIRMKLHILLSRHIILVYVSPRKPLMSLFWLWFILVFYLTALLSYINCIASNVKLFMNDKFLIDYTRNSRGKTEINHDIRLPERDLNPECLRFKP
jgi:hypothetical protein